MLRSCCSTICCQRPQDSKHEHKQKETDLIDPSVSGHRPPFRSQHTTRYTWYTPLFLSLCADKKWRFELQFIEASMKHSYRLRPKEQGC